jgi:phenylpropionate dioxygenase-like ring-hydroxylating dioxygenase large terminal subunit
MLSREENELLTQVGSGTPMGALMRRYWIPALLSWEVSEPDCPPVRVKLLGENLVAFRDSEGRVGLVDEFCAHRRSSLFLGRNEEGGLRCVYHGWKYDVEGKCVDMPCEPAESDFKDKVQLKAYPTVEMGDVIWVYMGPKEKMPALPKFEWAQVPQSHRIVSKVWEECNWLQALEGGLDTTHVSFLHRSLTTSTTRGTGGYWLWSTAPKIEVELTDYGYCYAGIRSRAERESYVRAYQFMMPFHKYHPQSQINPGKPLIAGHAWVPMDDENTMVYNISYSFGEEPLTEPALGGTEAETYDMKAGFRKKQNKDNDWLIDRQIQKMESYTGIEGTTIQDQAVQESMGPIVDRSQERLGSIDKAIVAARLLLLRAIKTVQAGGDPPGVGSSYYSVRAIEKILPAGVRWQEALKSEICPQPDK